MLALTTHSIFAASKKYIAIALCIITFHSNAGELFSFTYTFDASTRGNPDEVLSGVLEGQLAEDGDTIHVEKIVEAYLSGVSYNISESSNIRAANPINSPKVSFSGNALDIWVCAQGFSVTYENGGGDCAFGITGGFLISPYVDTDTAECF